MTARALLTTSALLLVIVLIGALSMIFVLPTNRTDIHINKLEQQVIVIGEITNRSIEPIVWDPFINGRDLYLAELAASDPDFSQRYQLKIITRDDQGDPSLSSRYATELAAAGGDILVGSAFSHTGLAISDVAKREGIPYLATWASADDVIWKRGHRYTFRILPGIYLGAKALALQAARDYPDLEAWASVGFSFEDGRSGMKTFKTTLAEHATRPRWIVEHWTKLKGLDAGGTIGSLESKQPDAFAFFMFGPDLAKFIRQGRAREFFDERPVFGIEMGYDLTLGPLGEDIVPGWHVSGYPWYAIEHPAHKKFVADYQQRYNENPNVGALAGYMTYQAIVAAIKKSELSGNALHSESLTTALTGMEMATPLGPLHFRIQDNALSIGAWIGKTGYVDGHARMVDIKYIPAEALMPADTYVKSMRSRQTT